MSLFTELLRLCGARRPTEDFFTEIVAVLLRRGPGLAVEWLTEIGVTDLEGLAVTGSGPCSLCRSTEGEWGELAERLQNLRGITED